MKELCIPQPELGALEKLNAHAVEYLLIGGFAMRFYGPAFARRELQQPRKKIRLHNAGYRLEILTSVNGLDFESAYGDRQLMSEKDFVVPVVSKAHLASIKRVAANSGAARAEKELRDVEALESVEAA